MITGKGGKRSCLASSNGQPLGRTARIRISVCHNLRVEAVLTGSVDNGRPRWWWCGWCGATDDPSTVDKFIRHATNS